MYLTVKFLRRENWTLFYRRISLHANETEGTSIPFYASSVYLLLFYNFSQFIPFRQFKSSTMLGPVEW
jgi:hypothetical protein